MFDFYTDIKAPDAVYDFKIAVFDLDMTLWDEKDLFPYTQQILSHLKSKDIHMYICSFNTKADEYCKLLNIDHYFSGIYFGQNKSKYAMLQEIKSKHNIEEPDIIFFDDNFHNIADVRKNSKIQTVLIMDGLRWDHIPLKTKADFTNQSYRLID
jgi:hypothetical protein